MTSRISTQEEWSFLMPREKITRAWGYIRESGEDQSKYSKIFQRKKILERCKEEGWAIREEDIRYDGQTGKYWRDRRDLQEIIAAAKRHEFDVLVLYRLDRFARNRDHQIIIREQLQYYGVKIVTLDPEEHSDDDSISGRIIREVFAIMAELELKKIRDRCQDGLRERYETDGKIPVGKRPLYGYVYDDPMPGEKGHYIPKETVIYTDPEGIEWTETKVIAYMHELTDDRMSTFSISIELNRLGIPTPNGKSIWKHQVVASILLNDTYATGTVWANKRKYTYMEGGIMHREIRPESEMIRIDNGAIPLITIERYTRTVNNIRKNKKFSPRRGGIHTDALCRCGMAVCALCGANLYVRRQRTEGRANYVCSKAKRGYHECTGVQVECHILDEEVWAKAVTIIRDPAILENQLRKRYEDDPTRDEIATYDRAIAELLPRIKNIVATIENTGGESSKTLLARLQELEGRKERFENERDLLVRKQVDWAEEQENITLFKRKCEELRLSLDTDEIDYEFKVDALDYLGIHVVVKPADQKRRFLIGTSPDGLTFAAESLTP